MIVVQVGDPLHIADKPTKDGPDTAIHYRRPRAARLAVYKAEKHPFGPSSTYGLCSLVSVLAVDSFCDWGAIPVPSPLFSKCGAAADFGDQGTLTHISNTQAGPLTAVTAAASSSGTSSDGAAATATVATGKTAPTTPDPVVAALQQQVTCEELQAKLLQARQALAKAAAEA